MAKDPAFLFYPGDWIGGTMGMTFEEKGAYLELLMLQFNRGHMTSHMVGLTVGQLWDKVKDKFEVDDDGKFFNARLDVEKEKRKAFTKSRKNNVSGKNQYTPKNGHMTSHMENENKDGNKDTNEKEKGVQGEKPKIPDQDEFLRFCHTILLGKYAGLEFALKAKYTGWVDDGWKDGNGKAIRNWKTKISNTIPYLKPMTNEKHDRSDRADEVNDFREKIRVVSGNAGR